MSNQVLELLPEIELIKDKDLRERVIAVWAEAMAWRNWTNAELLFRSHVPRVSQFGSVSR